MSTPATRVERDSMGEMTVPADALYGATTARAVENFPIARRPLPPALIRAFGHLKAACAAANRDLGKLDARLADAIIAASEEVAAGRHDKEFPVDVYQTGSGTSTNMNANEVIANLANQRLGLALGAKDSAGGVHPNDHVNMGQSSNDTFPTAMNVAAAVELGRRLGPALERLRAKLGAYAEQWDGIVKVGRTHLMDATPIRMGQVFKGFEAQVGYCWAVEVADAREALSGLAIGGTAVGTGINTHPEFAGRVAQHLNAAIAGSDDDVSFHEARNHPRAQATRDDFVSAHAKLKTIAVALTKIANDIRLLASGPRCGIGELILPAVQPGSSIMPGKENPVIAESMIQVACRVIGNDATVTTAGLGGVGSIFELNVAMPVMIDAFLESASLLANVCDAFTDKLLAGLKVNEARCRELLEISLMNITPFAPVLGYDVCAKLAKEAQATGKTVRELVTEKKLLPAERVDELLNYDRMTRPG